MTDRPEPDADPEQTPEQVFEQMLGSLRVDYARRLLDKLDELSDAVAAAHTRGATVAARREACSLAHRLRGTAGAYGFAAVGVASGELEDALAVGDGPSTERALESARQAVAAAIAETDAPAAERRR